MSVRKKLRKLTNYPEQFIRDMRSPLAQRLAGPILLRVGRQLGRVWADERLIPGVTVQRSEASRVAARPREGDTEVSDYTAHLFSDVAFPFRRGVTTLPWRVRDKDVYLPEMLDFACVIAPFADPRQAGDVDVFCSFGVTDHMTHNLAREAAAKSGKPLVTLEYGFISSLDIALKGSRQHSIILSKGPAYYDSTQPTYGEAHLNSPAYSLSPEQQARARNTIDKIVDRRVTKYNHAPDLDLGEPLSTSSRPRILLVDQRYGDASVRKGLADDETFERMLDFALAQRGHDILVKLHPDAIGGGKGSYFAKLLTSRSVDKRVIRIDFDVNPYALFGVVSQVCVASSQLGFEALMAGKEVHCFGVPFYAGWGLTEDHVDVQRRERTRTLEEVFHLYYLECSRYYVPGVGLTELE